MLENVTAFYRQFGVWILLTGTMTTLVALGYLESATGIAALALGLLLTLSEPGLFLFRALRERAFSLDRGLIRAWSLGALAFVFFFARRFMDATGDETAAASPLLPRVRMALLLLFVIAYAAFFVYRLALSLGYTAIETQTRSLYASRRNFLQKTVFSIFAVLPLLVGVNFLVTRWNPTLDLSPGYFSFGDESRTIISSVKSDVTVHVFLPVQQAIRDRPKNQAIPELYRISEEVRVMMEQLPIINSRIQIKMLNADLPADRGADFKHVNNGTIVLRANHPEGKVGPDEKPFTERRVYVYSEKDMEKLERETVRALIQVSSPQKNIYFTAAHGERYNLTDNASRAASIETLKDELRFYNFQLKKLGTEQGWPGPIPADADAVLITGPTVKFAADARESLNAYIEKGGRVLIAIDPDGKEDFDWLLEDHPKKSFLFRAGTLSNIEQYPGVAFTDSTADHRITENLTIAGRSLLAFPDSGYFEESKEHTAPEKSKNPLKSLEPVAIVHTTFNTIVDKNRNGKKDGAEENGRFALAIAYQEPTAPAPPIPAKDGAEPEKKPGDQKPQGPRVVIFSSVGWMAENGIRFPVDQRNVILAADSLFWLTESPLAAGLQPEERKTRAIQVTDELKLRNIVLGMILFPVGTGLIMAIGMWLYRRRRKFIGDLG